MSDFHNDITIRIERRAKRFNGALVKAFYIQSAFWLGVAFMVVYNAGSINASMGKYVFAMCTLCVASGAILEGLKRLER